jgi:4-oxalmesaconate hydratase
MIIDCHGHYTTAPKALEDWRNRQIAGLKDAALTPSPSALKISDDELREVDREQSTAEDAQARQRPHHLLAARASFMAHHIGDFSTSATWAAICNELCARVAQLFPTTSSARRCCRSRRAWTRAPAFPSWNAAFASTASSAST